MWPRKTTCWGDEVKKVKLPPFTPWQASEKKPDPKVVSPKPTFTPIQELPGIREPITIREFRGVNTLDPLSINDNFAMYTKNLDGYPYLETRKGYSALEGVIAKVIGLGVWMDVELHAIFADGTWRKWNGSTWITLIGSLDVTKDWSFTNFKGNFSQISLIASNGSSVKRYDGLTIQSVTAPTGINFIETFSDRLFGAVGNTLHFSVYRNGNDWTSAVDDETASGWIIVETSDGEPINAVKPGIGHVTVFKPNSIHELYGYSPGSYEVNVVTLEVGAINNKSIVNIGGTMYFVHTTGIYQYQGGTAPSNAFSLSVDRYIKQIDKNRLNEVCASTDGHKLYFAIPDRILVYDLLYEIWTVYEDVKPNVMIGWKDVLYLGSDRVYKPDVDSASVHFEWITKPFSAGSLAQNTRWYRMFVVADILGESALYVHLSKTIDGNDWELVQLIGGVDHIEKTRIIIPVTIVADANIVRVKFSGVGQVRIHEFTRQVRELPLV